MNIKPFILGTLTIITAAGLLSAKSPKSNGTSILHFKVRASLVPTAGSSVLGDVDVNQNRQGNADNQRFNLNLSGLTAGHFYLVLVSTNGGTDLSVASSFTADADGSLSFRHMKVGSSNGKGKGKGKEPLPDALNPLAAIRQIVIADVDTTAAGTLIPLGTSNVVNVASANLGQPTFATYLVSRPMNLTGTDPDATGALRIKANNKSANLNLSIAGLVPGATSYLWSNGNFWLEGTNDARGQVVFATTFTVPEALAIRTLAVSDANTNLVLTTTIP